MTDTSPKKNSPKLKWWQKGALIGFGVAVTLYLVIIASDIIVKPSGPIAVGFMIIFNLPVFPIFFLVGNLLNLFFPSKAIILAHFISWTLGGVIYAGIFHIIRQLTKHSQKNKRR